MATKILLITSGQPSINPRLVKEADALCEAGYEVEVLYVFYNHWASQKDVELLKSKKWKAKRVGGSPFNQQLIYLIGKARFKIARNLVKKIGFNHFMAELALSRATIALIRAAKRHKADFYIAHNLAALPAATIAAKKHNALAGFDAEDYHRQESDTDINSLNAQIKVFLENKYLPELDYFSTASPMISMAYQNNYPTLHPITILNSFPRQNLVNQPVLTNTLRLFWFSQTIGPDRGLEQIISAIASLPHVELHLLGNYEPSLEIKFKQIAMANGSKSDFIHFYHPIDSDEIFKFASQFDVGLASEISTPLNRDICLTNKIFTYVQSGLAVMASSTAAQSQFMEKYPNMGSIYRQNDPDNIRQVIENYIKHPELLHKHRLWARIYANEALNWETEKQIFLSGIESLIYKRTF